MRLLSLTLSALCAAWAAAALDLSRAVVVAPAKMSLPEQKALRC